MKKYVYVLLLVVLALTACGRASRQDKERVDALCRQAYRVRYTDVDSTRSLAEEAIRLSRNYPLGRARAMWRLAYVRYQEMDYDGTLALLDSVYGMTSNQVTMLCANVLQMKVYQRIGDGRGFYQARSRAERHIRRIEEEKDQVEGIDVDDYHFALSEFHIISSTYYYYQEQYDKAREEMRLVSPMIEEQRDTTQLLSYYYMMGSGGLVDGDYDYIALSEFRYLFDCYCIARRANVTYFEGNALQALADRLKTPYDRELISSVEGDAYVMLFGQHMSWMPEDEEVSDSLFSLALAKHSLRCFENYNDLFQTACVYRTIGELEAYNGNYTSALSAFESALECVNKHHSTFYPDKSALLTVYDMNNAKGQSIERQWIENPNVSTVPEWMAGIRQQLSLLYSDMNNKAASDYNRAIYLDILESTSQNKEMESRMSELQAENAVQNRLLLAAAVVFVLLLLFIIMCMMRLRRHDGEPSVADKNGGKTRILRGDKQRVEELTDELEETEETCEVSRRRIHQNKTRNSEKRAKVSLVQAVVPFLDRIINEVSRMKRQRHASPEQLEYVAELSGQIIEYNDILTEWIKMERGELSLQITTIHLSELFSILERGHFAYDQKGVTLRVNPTDLCVKADEALTMFMLNTLADNARKFTPSGGSVTIDAKEGDGYVELSVTDTGCGISEEDADTILNNKAYDASKIGMAEGDDAGVKSQKGFGFGLMNCKGIIEKYKKTAAIFQVCTFGIESRVGKGSRFFFRLPRVLMCVAALLLGSVFGKVSAQTQMEPYFQHDAATYYDMAQKCNSDGQFEDALAYADSALYVLNSDYAFYDNSGVDVFEPAELRDFKEGKECDYELLLQIRNQIAVSALALHDLDLYRYNNRIYIKLFKLSNQDNTLPSYCDNLAKTESATRQITAVLVILSILTIFFIYLFFRGRKRVADRIAGDLNTQIAQTKDQLSHLRYEENRLYVQNQVLDNCLSTIKHESMYYPSRIKHLVMNGSASQDGKTDASSVDFDELSELTSYYKELYTLLCQQAERQVAQQSFRREQVGVDELLKMARTEFQKLARKLHVDAEWQQPAVDDGLMKMHVRVDATLLQEMFIQLFRYVFSAFPASQRVEFGVEQKGSSLLCTLKPDAMHLTPEEAHNLFYPAFGRTPLLIVKQILRDFDAMNNNPGLRLIAEEDSIVWTLPRGA